MTELVSHGEVTGESRDLDLSMPHVLTVGPKGHDWMNLDSCPCVHARGDAHTQEVMTTPPNSFICLLAYISLHLFLTFTCLVLLLRVPCLVFS